MLERLKKTVTNKNFYLSVAGVFIGAFLLLILFNSVIMPWYTNYSEGLTVPNITRMPLDEAKATLTHYGLRYEVADKRKNALFPAGFVTDQQPLPGELVKPERKIYLTVNRQYQPTVKVPKVVNLSFRSAKIQLKNAGLRVGVVSYESSRFKNTVLRQSVKEGEKVEKGKRIDLAIGDGLGQRSVAVPEIIGMDFTAAQQQLRRAGLRVGDVHYRPQPDVAPGTVVDFSPRKERLVIGTTLKLIIAQKAQKSPKPDQKPIKKQNEN